MSVPSPSDSLDHWLTWLESIHPSEIDMGLDRVGRVADRLSLRPCSMPLILVGGTNGKGSTVALLGEIYKHAGYRVGLYTSPHIETFNERMSVNGQMLGDQTIVNALHKVEFGRSPDTLTYFEYTTLAAMVAFQESECDVTIMEVGLGGRLDATNLWDCDCAILTSIALDHQAYLGDTREEIAAEKVAIGRSGKPLIVGEPNPPANLLEIANANNMLVTQIDSNASLPQSALTGMHQQRNAACALQAVESLQAKLPVASDNIKLGLQTVRMPGRFERHEIDSQVVVFDVAHNPAAATTVHDAMQAEYPDHEVYAVFAALKDKDITGVVQSLAPMVSAWFCAQLSVPRAIGQSELVDLLEAAQDKPVSAFASIELAWESALAAAAGKKSVVLVAGSFFTLTELPQYAGIARHLSPKDHHVADVTACSDSAR